MEENKVRFKEYNCTEKGSSLKSYICYAHQKNPVNKSSICLF